MALNNNVGRIRRRNQIRPVYDTEIPSPCVAVCQLNDSQICRGCYRNVDEIREWPIMSKEQKLQALDMIEDRRAKSTTTTNH